MATKAKTDGATNQPASAGDVPSALPAAFEKALALLDGGKAAQAIQAFEALVADAQAAGEWAVKRRAQVYLALAQGKADPAAPAQADPLTEIQARLNQRDTGEAHRLLDKALKGTPNQGVLHYLRAIAHAQAENAEASADALKRALELDRDLVFQWHMDKDFDPIRKSPLFAFTENR